MIKREFNRYKDNGIGIVNITVSVLISLAFYSFWMEYMKFIWPSYMQLKEDYNLTSITHFGLLLEFHGFVTLWGCSAILYFVYTSKLPFFE